jgi:hypothetical protein
MAFRYTTFQSTTYDFSPFIFYKKWTERKTLIKNRLNIITRLPLGIHRASGLVQLAIHGLLKTLSRAAEIKVCFTAFKL